MRSPLRIAVLGAGLAGCSAALRLAGLGFAVDLFDRAALPMSGASLHNEGKLHLGYVYAADPSKQTHKLMARGSLNFLPILAELTGGDSGAMKTSHTFSYGVPHDSMLTPDEVGEHFARTDAEVAASGADIGPSRRIDGTGRDGVFRSEALAALFETREFAVDTAEIADFVSAAIAAHPMIELRMSTEIVAAEAIGDGALRITSRTGNERRTNDYPAAINALWDDRLRIDAMLDIAPSGPTLARYKATLRTRSARNDATATLPSLTLISGPFGDMVNYGDGGFYLSWYPACKLGQVDGTDPRALYAAANDLSCEALLADTLDGLGRYVHGIEALAAKDSAFAMSGAIVIACGESDIDRRDSGLHRRTAIGPELHGRWLSLNTGKYCLAPLFGREGADMIAAALA